MRSSSLQSSHSAHPSVLRDHPQWCLRWGELTQAIAIFLALTALLFHRCWLYGESFCTTIDMYNQHYPLTVGAVRTVLGGELPLWCPWRASGTPWFAATSANLLDPFALWLFLFPGDLGLNLQFVTHTFATALSYYVFLRYWRASHPSALCVAILGVWSPVFLYEMPWRILTGAHWTLPLATLCFDAALRARRPALPLLGAGLFNAIGLLASQPQIWVYEVLLVALYGIIWWWPRRSGRAFLRVVGCGMAVGVLMFGLTAIQVLPFVEFFKLSNRVAPVEGAQSAPATLPQERDPSILGEGFLTLQDDLDQAQHRLAWHGEFYFTRGNRALLAFPGVEPGLLLLALYGVLRGWRRPTVRWVTVLAVLAFLGTVSVLRDHLVNVISGVQPHRLVVYLSWFAGIPAAIGLDALRTNWRLTPVRAASALPTALALCLGGKWLQSLWGMVGYLWMLDEAYYLRFGASAALLACVGIRIIFPHLLGARLFRRLVVACVCAVGLAHAAFGAPRTLTTSPLQARNPVWTTYLKDLPGERLGILVPQDDPRYYGLDLEAVLYSMPLHPNHGVLYDPPVLTAGNYDNLLVETYVEYLDMLNLGRRSTGWFNMIGVAYPTSPLVDLLGLRYVASHSDPRKAPDGEIYRQIHYDPNFVYHGSGDFTAKLSMHMAENTRRLPRSFFVSRAVVVSDPAARLAVLAAPTFDARRGAILNEALPPEFPVAPVRPGQNDPAFTPARISAYHTNSLSVELDAPTRGLLVLSDVAFPGWTATVDGEPAPILTAYHTFRAVPVGPGAHTVDFRYRPRPFAIGWRLSAASWLLVLAGVAVCLVRRRRAQGEPG